MRGLLIFVIGMMMAVTQGVWAQWMGPINQPFTDKIEEEEVAAPKLVSKTVPAEKVNLFKVVSVTVVVSDSGGFARDVALDRAARQSLPKVLELLPMSTASATEVAKSVGDPLGFVSRYTIVKEGLIPTYSLVVDLTFDEAKLRSNFGGKNVSETKVVTAASTTYVVAGAAADISGTAADTETPSVSPSAAVVGHNAYVVKVVSGDPKVQDQIYKRLGEQPDTRVSYRIMTSSGAELNVTTDMAFNQVQQLVGGQGEVRMAPMPVVVPTLPTAPVVPLMPQGTAAPLPVSEISATATVTPFMPVAAGMISDSGVSASTVSVSTVQ